MKYFILILLISYSLTSCSQDVREVRLSGYLFIETSIKNNNPLLIDIDSPKWYYFKPIVKGDKSNFKKIIENLYSHSDKSLYLASSLTETKNRLNYTNFSLKKFLNDTTINIDLLEESKKINLKKKTFIKVKNDTILRRIYRVVYIDGVWEKVTIPYKWIEIIPIGRYRISSLNMDDKNDVYYYFLKKINAISYDIDIHDDSVLKLENDKPILIKKNNNNYKNILLQDDKSVHEKSHRNTLP